MTTIAFDLDGTLSDPAQGITASINYALEQVGESTQDPTMLLKYIGPPLTDIFADLLQTSNRAVVGNAINHYRNRYQTIGYQENHLYQGVIELLSHLQKIGCKLYIATSKRPDIAMSVIEHFNLTRFFAGILGCGLNKRKKELLLEIMEMEPNSRVLMVGDRLYDMIAGHQVSAHCIGVLWGYGSRLELEENGADVVVGTLNELLIYIHDFHKQNVNGNSNFGQF